MNQSDCVKRFLTRENIGIYLDRLKRNEESYDMIRQSVELKYEHMRDINMNEFAVHIDNLPDRDLKEISNAITLLGDGDRSVTIDHRNSRRYAMKLFVFRRRNNGKYDIIVAHGTQKIDPQEEKPVVYGGIWADLEFLDDLSMTYHSFAGASAARAMNRPCYSGIQPDYIFAYMIQILSHKGILTVLPNGVVELDIN